MVFSKHINGPSRLGRYTGVAMAGVIFWLWAAPVNGYVLKGPHVLDMMVRKLAGAQTLQVDQQVVILDAAISDQPIELTETLNYVFPDRFRSEIKHENSHRIQVLSQGQALTIVDDIITGEHEGRFDRYKDLLLYNSRQLLQKVLYTHGVDVGTTSLGRMDDRIVYVIGADYPNASTSQVWVDKERFVPLRWINVIAPADASTEPERFEFIYRNWQNLDGVWYPMLIETYHNRLLVRRIQVAKVQANTAIAGELLNIAHLMTIYKKEAAPPTSDEAPQSEVDEVERTIEDFKKKFEP
jgi:outer membrane lipoprotein-sorting protein